MVGSTPSSLLIQLMAQSNFEFHRDHSDWFDRCAGSWTSHRRYVFNMEKMDPVNLVTEFTIEKCEEFGEYIVTWTGQTSGKMELRLVGETLHRSRDYFGDGANSSRVQRIDEDAIALFTSYDGLRFREEVRLLNADQLRLRQTIGYDIKTDEPRLVGQYYEIRQPQALY